MHFGVAGLDRLEGQSHQSAGTIDATRITGTPLAHERDEQLALRRIDALAEIGLCIALFEKVTLLDIRHLQNLWIERHEQWHGPQCLLAGELPHGTELLADLDLPGGLPSQCERCRAGCIPLLPRHGS